MAESPYFNRSAIRDERYFCGRQGELRQALSVIGAAQPQCVAIVGERRVGKSSFLLHLKRPSVHREYLHAPERYVFVYMSLDEMRGLNEAELWRHIAKDIPVAAGCAEGARAEGEGEADGSVADCYERVKGCVSRLQSEGKVLIVLLDEFEAIVGDKQFGFDSLGRLRALTNTYDVALVTATRAVERGKARCVLCSAMADRQRRVSPSLGGRAVGG